MSLTRQHSSTPPSTTTTANTYLTYIQNGELGLGAGAEKNYVAIDGVGAGTPVAIDGIRVIGNGDDGEGKEGKE